MKKHMIYTSEVKKRHKMYKKGKHWVVAPILFLGVAGGITLTSHTSVYADETAIVDTQTDSQKERDSSSKPGEMNTQTGVTQSNVDSSMNQPISEQAMNPTMNQGNNQVDSPSIPSVSEALSDVASSSQGQSFTEVTDNKENYAVQPATTQTQNNTTKVDSPAKPVEINSPELNQAVENAKKDPNVTVNEKHENLGVLSPEEAQKKKIEIEQAQKQQAQEINQVVSQLQLDNKKVESYNEKAIEVYNKQKNEYQQALEKAKANEHTDGYLSTPETKYLLFDQTSTKDAQMVSVKADTYIDAQKFFDDRSKDGWQALFQELTVDSKKYQTNNADLGKTSSYQGGWMAVLQKDKPVIVTYDHLNGSYNGQTITKVEYTYTLKQSPNGYVNAFFHKDPTITITYATPIDPKQSVNTEINFKVRFFGENGKEILPEKDKQFLYSGASLNSRGQNTTYEYMTLQKGATFLKINGSKVDLHGNMIYSASDIDLGTAGIKTEDWDGGATGKEYIGACVIKTDSPIEFSFGNEIKNNPGLTGSAMWFAFNTNLRAFVPEFPILKTKDPEKTIVNYNIYELYEAVTPQPDKKVENVKSEDINHKNVMRGDTLNYDMTWDLRGYDPNYFQANAQEIAQGIHFSDDYDEIFLVPQKAMFKVTDAKGNSLLDQVNVTWNDTKGMFEVSAKDPEAFIKAYGGQELMVLFPTTVKANVTGNIVNRAVQNTFGQSIETQPVDNSVPDINVHKDVVVHVGDTDSINGKTIAKGDLFNYRLDSSTRPANMGTDTIQWLLTDTLDNRDQFTNQLVIVSRKDFVDAKGQKVPAGTDITNDFDWQVTKTADGKALLSIVAKKDFLDTMNLKVNQATAQGWSAYVQVKRVGLGEVDNTFSEDYNGSLLQSNIVTTKTPDDPHPHKVVENTKKENINDTNVMRGDTLIYDMTWDLTGYDKNFAFGTVDVTKGVSFFDDYGETKVSPSITLLKVLTANGTVLNDQFLIQDQSGKLVIVAKNPQAFITNYGGQNLTVTFPVKVKVNVTGDIYNQAIQNTFGKEVVTEKVVNHVPNADPKKDVVVHVGDTDSINDKTIAKGDLFNYRLDSSTRPANIRTDTTQWSLTDLLDNRDQFTNQLVIVTQNDFIDAQGQTVSSWTDITNDFDWQVTQTTDGKTLLSIVAKKDFLDTMNLKANQATEQGWSAYVQVKRVGLGEVDNTFSEDYNGSLLQSNIVTTKTPDDPHPHKVVENTKKENINDTNVMRGDTLIYDMTWDLTGYDKNFAFGTVDVTKGVSFSDDYDETKVSPFKELLKVSTASGEVINDQLTIEWQDSLGKFVLMAKDPEAFITTYGGQNLTVTFPVKVKVDVTGDIDNQAIQNTFGKEVMTEKVVNHVPKADPKKDVVVHVGDAASMNDQTIAHNDVFHYELDSSIRPAHIGTDTTEWSMKDILSVKDQATGQTTILAKRDFVLADGTKVKAGTDISKYFEVSFETNEKGETVVTVTAKKDFLDTMNLKVNQATAQGWSAYIQVKRVGYDDVENTFTESYNGEVLQSNTVVTHTPKEPEVSETPQVPQETSKVTPQPVSTSKIPEPQVVKEASVIPTLPKTGEKNHPLMAVFGSVIALLGGLGMAWKNKKSIKK